MSATVVARDGSDTAIFRGAASRAAQAYSNPYLAGFGLGLVLSLSACSLAPDFKAPEVEVPAQFKEAAQLPEAERGTWKEAQPAEHLTRGEWWRVFNDEKLNELEAQALAANAQLQAAAARVRQARSIVGIVNADRMPQVGAGFGPARTKPTGVALGLPPGVDVELGLDRDELFRRAGSGRRGDPEVFEVFLLALVVRLADDAFGVADPADVDDADAVLAGRFSEVNFGADDELRAEQVAQRADHVGTPDVGVCAHFADLSDE